MGVRYLLVTLLTPLAAGCTGHIEPTLASSTGGSGTTASGGATAPDAGGTVSAGGAPASGRDAGAPVGGSSAGVGGSAAAGAGGTGATSSGSSGAGGALPGANLLQVDFQARPPGRYTETSVAEDFGEAPPWSDGLDEGRARIVDESGNRFLRVTYVGGEFGPAAGGVQFHVPLGASYTDVYLAYRVRFQTGFTFMRGGKLPGLVGGTAPTGCTTDAAALRGGFSARMMWRTDGHAVQYLYYPEKQNSCGDDFDYTNGDAPVSFVPGRWHRVEHHLVMNTPGRRDGKLQAWFDGQLVLDRALMYRSSGASFAVDALYFSTFFGGSDATWAPPAAQRVDFDDFVVAESPVQL